jgi:hypothetical protein
VYVPATKSGTVVLPLIFPFASEYIALAKAWLPTRKVAGSFGEKPVPEIVTVAPTAASGGFRVIFGFTTCAFTSDDIIAIDVSKTMNKRIVINLAGFLFKPANDFFNTTSPHSTKVCLVYLTIAYLTLCKMRVEPRPTKFLSDCGRPNSQLKQIIAFFRI